MVTTQHNPEKDIRQLANAILRCAEVPKDQPKNCLIDLTYLAEKAIPLAKKLKNRYRSRWKPVGAPRPGLKGKAGKKINKLK